MKENDLKGKFISRILREEAQNIETAKQKVISGFRSRSKLGARYETKDTTLTMTHPMKLRFIDMKTRNTKDRGKVRKKSHPVHNKIIFGHLNNIVRRLSFEYTSEIKEMLQNEISGSL